MIKMGYRHCNKIDNKRELYFKISENALRLAQKYTPEEVFGGAVLDTVSF
jgi:hypothetical protein